MTAPEYTMTEQDPITLAGTPYRVEVQDMLDGTEPMVWLYGPRAVYFLRGYLNDSTGLHQVISWNSGAPLRKHGNEIRVTYVGGVIEQYVKAPREPRPVRA